MRRYRRRRYGHVRQEPGELRHVRQEMTLAEFWNPPPVAEENRDNWNVDIRSAMGNDPRWYGMDIEAVKDLPNRGWPAGVTAAMERLNAPELAIVGNTRLRRRWSEDDGETVDYARFLDGLPYFCQPFRAPGGNGGRIITIRADATAAYDITAEQIAWKVYAIVRAVDCLESAGFRVAVEMSYCTTSTYSDGSGWLCLVRVKEPEHPVDLSQIAAVLSAGAFRWYGFQWQSSVPMHHKESRGGCYDAKPEDPAVLYLAGSVYTQEAAQRWVNTALCRLDE